MRYISNFDLQTVSGGAESGDFDLQGVAFTSIMYGSILGAFGAYLGYNANASATMSQALVRAAQSGLALEALGVCTTFMYCYFADALSQHIAAK